MSTVCEPEPEYRFTVKVDDEYGALHVSKGSTTDRWIWSISTRHSSSRRTLFTTFDEARRDGLYYLYELVMHKQRAWALEIEKVEDEILAGKEQK